MSIDRDMARRRAPDLEKLNLKTSVWTAISRDGRFKTIGALSLASDKELLTISGIGKESLKNIRKCLEEYEKT